MPLPDGMTVLRPNPHMADLIALKAKYTELYLRGEVTQKCARFYVLHQRIGQSPALASLLQRSGAGTADMLADINQCRAQVEALAKTMAGLDSGDLELVAWTREGHPTDTPEINRLNMGAWQKGKVSNERAKDQAMEWIPVPVLVWVAIGAAATGAYLLNLYLAGKKVSDEADYLRAQTEKVMQQAIADAPAADRAGLASAFADAQRSAQSAANQGGPGWLSQIGAGLGKMTQAVVDTTTTLVQSADSWLPWVLGGWAAIQVLSALSNIFGGGGRRCC